MKKNMFLSVASLCFIASYSLLIRAAAESKVTQNSYIDYIHSRLQEEICGICREPRADIYWINPHSHGAHRECYNLILPALKSAYQKLDTAFTINPENKDAHHKFTRLIQENIGFKTIKEFALHEDGMKRLEEICNAYIEVAIQHIRDNKSPWE